MKLGIIGAMAEEVAQLKEAMSQPAVVTLAGMDFYTGAISGKEVVVVQSGIGKVNAAVCAQVLIGHFRIEGIVNTGIAGSLKKEIDIGDIVLATDLVHHDMDAAEFGYPLGQVPQMDVFSFPADEELRQAALACFETLHLEAKAHCGRIVSGDQFISDKDRKQQISDTFNGYCTEMEGAAIAQAAYLSKIPCLVIRSISDKADDSAQMVYEEFEKLAVKRCVSLTQALIKRL
ncbi:MAG: 5'-methylthioadenosine/adenosylhomocysteine nucleosidase [Lachnospiraceae bacterium]